MAGLAPRCTLDFESKSECDLRDCGSWRYSLHPTTQVLCLCYRLPHWKAGRVATYYPAFPHLGVEEGDSFDDLAELFDWVTSGGLVEAHNAFFDRGIWQNVMVARHGWPEIALRQWRCSAAKAAAHSLPRKMEDLGPALHLPVSKDMEGHALMLKMSRPRKPNAADKHAHGRVHAPCKPCGGSGRVVSFKKDGTPTKKGARCEKCSGLGYDVTAWVPEMPTLWHESPEMLERLFQYCRTDVLTEEAASHALPDLSPEETDLYHLDQIVNERGFALDTEAIDVALELIDGEFTELNAELAELTNGAVTRATQRARMVAWLAEHNLELDNTQADTITAALESGALTPVVRRALEIMQALGKSSIGKYERMRNWVCPDGRVHGGLLYHGASTGRWTGAGVQPHNFPRGTIKEDPEVMWAFLKTRDRDLIVNEFGDVMQVLSSALRGVIIAG